MTIKSSKWDAGQYAKFLDERTRPAGELLSRIALDEPNDVADLGSGPGNSTALLKERWPSAALVGIDNSQEMLIAARAAHPEISFQQADIGSWSPNNSFDVIFTNAALQWVPDHEKLFPHLFSHVRKQGCLAVQMPNNHLEATHAAMREVAADKRWSADLRCVRQTPPVLAPASYYDLLAADAGTLDIWETRYFHVMDSVAAIAEWLKSTGLRPFLQALGDESEKEEFIREYVEVLKRDFKPRADGKVLMPFPRLFIIARKR